MKLVKSFNCTPLPPLALDGDSFCFKTFKRNPLISTLRTIIMTVFHQSRGYSKEEIEQNAQEQMLVHWIM